MSKIKKLAWLAVAAVAPLLVQGTASARSQAAILGHERFGSQAGCFNEWLGGPTQVCDGRYEWDIPVVYDNSGWMNIRVSARGYTIEQGTSVVVRRVDCQAFSVPSDGSSWIAGTMARTLLNNGAGESLVSTVFAHGFGGTWVRCGMETGTELFNVAY
jgi:hypothetical protein